MSVVQKLDINTGKYVKYDSMTGRELARKTTPGPYKRIEIITDLKVVIKPSSCPLSVSSRVLLVGLVASTILLLVI